jgi:hypothetical protein
VNRENGTGSSPKKKKLLFKEIEDVISVGALLRPTIVRAVGSLPAADLESLRATLIEAEQHLANSRLPFAQRFARAQDTLVKTYSLGPVWRFIAGRIEDSWKESDGLTVKELSVVSLLFGMVLEETESRLGTSQRYRRSA